MLRVLLLARGSGGDLFPLVEIGRRCRQRGHEVTLLTHAPYEGLARAAGLGFVPIDTPADFERMVEDRRLLDTPPGTAAFYQRHVVSRLVDEYRLAEAHSIPGTVLVAHHNCSLAALTAADGLQVPVVSLFLAPSYLAHLPLLEGLYRTLDHDLAAQRGRLGLPPVHDWRRWLAGADHHLALWPGWYAPAVPPWPMALTAVGFILSEQGGATAHPLGTPTYAAEVNSAAPAAVAARGQPTAHPLGTPASAARASESSPLPAMAGNQVDSDVLSEVNSAAPAAVAARGQPEEEPPWPALEDVCGEGEPRPVLLTHGTSLPLDASFFEAGAWAIARSARPGLLVTRHHHLLPSRLPPTVRWVPYLPFDELVPRVAAVIHHGGIGMAARCLAAAVPQLVLAAGFDRPDNGARLQALGVGTWLDRARWEPATAAEALARLLASGSVGRRCAQWADRMAAGDALGQACDLIEAAGTRPRSAQAAPPLLPSPGAAAALPTALGTLSPEKLALLAHRLKNAARRTE
jgi:rhamnosyltransferase subunit B